jgi:hypothetical protein
MKREQENFVSRRAAFKPIAAAAFASVAVIPAVAAQSSSELVLAIEAHRLAYDAFQEACTTEDETPSDTPEYAAAESTWVAMEEIEEAAFIAVCAYVCRSAEDGRAKANYLTIMLTRLGGHFQREHVEGLLRSIAGGQDV